MPASITMARVASMPKVAGSSRLMPASGPTPGSTPTSVPTRQPMKPYQRTPGARATPKPCARLESVSSTLEPERTARQRHPEKRVEEVERSPRDAERDGQAGHDPAALEPDEEEGQ